jgi:hypothetical protein
VHYSEIPMRSRLSELNDTQHCRLSRQIPQNCEMIVFCTGISKTDHRFESSKAFMQIQFSNESYGKTTCSRNAWCENDISTIDSNEADKVRESRNVRLHNPLPITCRCDLPQNRPCEAMGGNELAEVSPSTERAI